ncbi:uncharacterized protein LOC116188067 [Punica granatum]|uniref:Uncharacterized protein n=2 Tax=Punica granatum TaxID=22663 RepID=A0A2I0JI52_PUNGR|nr:uncharacterized protein LOC116188067 [Punica granatum]PKI55590.1 hypothetical protein CRG98_024018 [Punica granatum]
MGQAFRRAAGRVKAPSHFDAPKTKPVADRRVDPPRQAEQRAMDPDGKSQVNADNVLEERDPQFDAMLGQMVGRIRSKPGGKLEMGEAHVAEKYNRPLPKLRNTRPDSGRFEERPVPAGTLNVAQLRHIILLHQGKAEDHTGPMDARQIAEKFRVEVTEIERILKFISLPPENEKKEQNEP